MLTLPLFCLFGIPDAGKNPPLPLPGGDFVREHQLLIINHNKKNPVKTGPTSKTAGIILL